jgi:hypothetical protein
MQAHLKIKWHNFRCSASVLHHSHSRPFSQSLVILWPLISLIPIIKSPNTLLLLNSHPSGIFRIRKCVAGFYLHLFIANVSSVLLASYIKYSDFLSPRTICFNISWQSGGICCQQFPQFCLSEKSYNCPPRRKISRRWPTHIDSACCAELQISHSVFLTSVVSVEKSVVILIFVPLWVRYLLL